MKDSDSTMASNRRMNRRATVRRISVPISDATDDAISELLPYAGRGCISEDRARAWLVRMIVKEGVYALADRLRTDGSFRIIIRFDVADQGDRRALAWEDEASRVDEQNLAVLRKAEAEAATAEAEEINGGDNE